MNTELPRTLEDFLASLPPEEQQAIAVETERLSRAALEHLIASVSDADIAVLWRLICAWIVEREGKDHG
jgi:hypothetical protein